LKPAMKLPFAVLSSVPFVMVLSNSMLIPVLPAIQRALDMTPFRVGLVITAFSVAAGLAIPVGGYLSDRVGRKAVMVPGLVLFGLGGGIAGIAPALLPDPYLPILLGRVVQGIGAGGTYQIALALAGDIFQSEERSKAMGLLEAANGLGKVVSPVIGSAAALITWFAPFFVYPLLAWPSALGVALLVPEPGRKKRGGYGSGLMEVLKRKGPSLAASFLAALVVLFLLFGVLSYFSDILETRYGIKGFVKGFVIAIPVLVMAVTSWLSGTVMQKREAAWLRALVVGGLVIMGAAVIGVYLLRDVVLLTGATAVMGLGNGLILPALNTFITSAAGSSGRGAVTALYGTVRFLGAATGPPVFGLAFEAGALPIFAAGLVLVAIAAILAGLFMNQRGDVPSTK